MIRVAATVLSLCLAAPAPPPPRAEGPLYIDDEGDVWDERTRAWIEPIELAELAWGKSKVRKRRGGAIAFDAVGALFVVGSAFTLASVVPPGGPALSESPSRTAAAVVSLSTLVIGIGLLIAGVVLDPRRHGPRRTRRWVAEANARLAAP